MPWHLIVVRYWGRQLSWLLRDTFYRTQADFSAAFAHLTRYYDAKDIVDYEDRDPHRDCHTCGHSYRAHDELNDGRCLFLPNGRWT